MTHMGSVLSIEDNVLSLVVALLVPSHTLLVALSCKQLLWFCPVGRRWHRRRILKTRMSCVSILRDPKTWEWAKELQLQPMRHMWSWSTPHVADVWHLARLGLLPAIQMAVLSACDLHANAYHIAAENGHLEVVDWMLHNGCKHVNVCDSAAAGGQLEVIKWARAHGHELSPAGCIKAIENGHLDVIRWAHENKCDWDPKKTDWFDVTDRAIVDWAHVQGFC